VARRCSGPVLRAQGKIGEADGHHGKAAGLDRVLGQQRRATPPQRHVAEENRPDIAGEGTVHVVRDWNVTHQ